MSTSRALDHELPNWRELLERFAEERAPSTSGGTRDVSTTLRQLRASGTRIGVFTDAPVELARIALSHLGAERHVEVLETGAGAQERVSATWVKMRESSITRARAARRSMKGVENRICRQPSARRAARAARSSLRRGAHAQPAARLGRPPASYLARARDAERVPAGARVRGASVRWRRRCVAAETG